MDRSGDTNNNWENDSRPLRIPQMDRESRCAVDFVTVSVSMNGIGHVGLKMTGLEAERNVKVG